MDPQNFMALYPDMYDAADPPITSRFSRAKIDEVWTSVPARQNNKLLVAPSDIRIASLPVCTKVDDPMRQMIENPMMIHMMRAFTNMANAGQPSGRGMAPPINIDYRAMGESPLFRPEHQALGNGEGLQTQAPPQELQDTAHGAVAGPSTVDKDIDDMINKGFTEPPKPKVPTAKKRGDDEKDDADRADKRGGDKKNKKRDGDDKGHVDNRAAKRATTTKDYGTNLKTPPKLASLVLPCLFNNCKIYGTDKKFRVYPRPNESKYDKGFVFTTATKAKVWENVIEYCKKPNIPKTSSNFIK
jgi:hypothetical protein